MKFCKTSVTVLECTIKIIIVSFIEYIAQIPLGSSRHVSIRHVRHVEPMYFGCVEQHLKSCDLRGLHHCLTLGLDLALISLAGSTRSSRHVERVET